MGPIEMKSPGPDSSGLTPHLGFKVCRDRNFPAVLTKLPGTAASKFEVQQPRKLPLLLAGSGPRQPPRDAASLVSFQKEKNPCLSFLGAPGVWGGDVEAAVKEQGAEGPGLGSAQYQVGQLYSVAEASKNETGGGEGVEVLVNEPYEKDGEKGQYTHKIYHLQSKVPTFVRMLAPEGALNIHEKAWNAYPYCRTEDFLIKIETWHKPDLGTQENVHKLEPEAWKHVEAIYIDIADRSQVLSKDYKAEEDPAKFKSIKTGRGPLGPNWKQELVNQKDCPYMCAYKLVTVKFKWWGLQNKVENFIHKQERRLFTNFHRQLFCWLDKWVDLTMDDIRRMEEETKRQLDEVSGLLEEPGLSTQ
ncbi:hypothetical protein GH733_013891 [Mirounga leonina]|nr:hypothetical protein GH733_013891 [Mirounga leonina]